MANLVGLQVSGPYGKSSGSKIPFELDLYNAENSRLQTSVETNKSTIPGAGAKQSVLTPIGGRQSISFDGEVGFNRIARNYSSGTAVTDAVQNWVRRFEALVLEKQGVGWQIEDIGRGGITYAPKASARENTDLQDGILFNETEWTYEAGKNQVKWDFEGKFVEGVNNVQDPRDYVSETDTTAVSVDELVRVFDTNARSDEVWTLNEVSQRRVSRSVEINEAQRLFLNNIDNSAAIGIIDTGVDMTISLDGTIFADETQPGANLPFYEVIDRFDTTLPGGNCQFRDAFSNRVWSGTVSSASTTVKDGVPRGFDFDIEIDIGNVLV